MKRDLTFLAIAAAATWALLPSAPRAAEDLPETGRHLYEQYCSACHGLDGRGRTDLAEVFVKRPPDLTRIASRNGGWFPDALVKEIVDGRLVAHGQREMPVWGDTLSRDQITLIAEYLYTLQVHPTPPAL